MLANLIACTIFSILISDPMLPEVSGMAILPSHPSIIHAVNDSGDGPYIHLIKKDGSTLPRIRFANVDPSDIEAIALDEDVLYIGDTGRNSGGSPTYTVYTWPPAMPITFHFPDDAIYDVEAMLAVNGTLMVIPKRTRAELWVMGEDGIMQSQGALADTRGRTLRYVTDATRDGDRVLIRSAYPRSRLHLFDWSGGIKLRAEKELPVVNEPQGEAVALLGNTYWTMGEYERRGYSFLHRYEGCLD